MQLKGHENPFRPGYGHTPPTLAGRQDVQQTINDLLQPVLAKERNPFSVLLAGPRGCGKTALLAWLKTHPERRRLSIYDLNTETRVDTAKEPSPEPRQPARTRAIGATVKIENVTFGLHHELGTTPDRAPDSKVIAQHLREIAGGKPLLLLLDEVHATHPEATKQLFIAHQSIAHEHPMLLVCAGTPDSEMHLSNIDASFVERLRTIPIGILEPSEAVRSITEPFAKPDVDVDLHTVQRAAQAAQHYPYFLQSMGSALWDAASKSNASAVDSRLLASALPAARTDMNNLWARRIDELSRHALLPMASELDLISSGTRPDPNAVDSLIDSLIQRWELTDAKPPSPFPTDNFSRAATQYILHTGFVWRPDPNTGKWEYGVPSLASNVTKSAVNSILHKIPAPHAAKALLALQALHAAGQPFTERSLAHDIRPAFGGNLIEASNFVDKLTKVGVVGRAPALLSDNGDACMVLTPKLIERTLDTLRETGHSLPRPSHPTDHPSTRNAGR